MQKRRGKSRSSKAAQLDFEALADAWKDTQPMLGEVVGHYLERYVAHMRQGTRKTYTWVLRDFFVPELPDVPTGADLDDLLRDGVRDGEFQAQTANFRRRVLHHCYRMASLRWPLLRNVVLETKPLPVSALVPRGLKNPGETWPLLFEALPNAQARGFAYVQRGFGARVGEARGVKPADVNFEAGTLFIARQRPVDSCRDAALKTDTSAATIPVDATLIELVRQARRDAMRLPPPRGEAKRNFLWPYYRHEQDALIGIMRKVSPEDFTEGNAWHVLRHTFGTEVVERFHMHPEKCKALLRHKWLNTTSTYIGKVRGGYFDADAMRELMKLREAASVAVRSPEVGGASVSVALPAAAGVEVPRA